MKVLSLFDGISCGRVALERACINIEKYYASEIKEEAIKVSKDNYQDIIQLGNVKDVQYIENIDLVMFGSPCQDFSVAGKADRTGINGERSGLFYAKMNLDFLSLEIIDLCLKCLLFFLYFPVLAALI